MNTLMARTIKTWTLVSVMLVASQALAQAPDLEDEDTRLSYAIGANFGGSLAQQGLADAIDIEVFIHGLRDQVNGESSLSEEDIIAALQLFQTKMEQEAQAAYAETAAAGVAFLAENANKEGVTVLDSGLQYSVIASGEAGAASPTLSNSVLAHYHGTLIDGTVFDSSVDRGEPASFPVSGVISGWTEALQLMKVGDKWRLYIPANMAYGDSSPSPAIPPASTLIFDVELLEVN